MSGVHEESLVDAAVAAALEDLDWNSGAIDTRYLKASIRRRRQRLAMGAAAGGTAAAAVTAIVTVTALMSGNTARISDGAAEPPATSSPETALPAGCGASEQGLLVGTTPALTADAGTAESSGPGIVPYTVTLTNPGSTPLRGIAGVPRLVDVAGGRVVATSPGERASGTVVDLPAGKILQLQGNLSLMDCARTGPPADSSAKQPTPLPTASLPPGEYSVYAFVDLTGEDRVSQVLSGGPWALTVR